MNKKFSTLLAAFLVAGGLGSSAFAQTSVKYKSSRYFQLENGGKYLIVAEGSERDSLALVAPTSGKFESLEQLNKTLWRVSVETIKDDNGFITATKYYLVNKVNGSYTLTYASASEDLSSYYAPGAVVAPGKWALNAGEIAAAGYDKDGYVNFADDKLSFGTPTNGNLYDATTKEAIGYKLALVGDAIKLAKGTADASKETTMADVKKLPLEYHSNFQDADLVFTITSVDSYKDYDLTADWLNKMANESFALSFNKDVSSSEENPFSASYLQAAELPLYTAAYYDWGVKQEDGTYPANSYTKALEDANSLVGYLNTIKQDAASIVKEIKVALEEKGTAGNTIFNGAPNKSDIELLNTSLTTLDDLLADTKVVDELLDVLDKTYGADGTFSDADVKEHTSTLDSKLDALNKKIDEIVKATNEAISKYDGAVKAATAEIYRPSATYDLDFEDYMIGEGDDAVTPVVALTAGGDVYKCYSATSVTINAQVTISAQTALTTLTSTKPGLTKSEQVIDGTTKQQVFAVVDEADTYITVDTSYVAEKEQYLGIRTMKLNRVPVKDDLLAREDEENIDEDTKYVLVPNVGDLARPAVFSMEVNPTTTAGDKITITAAYAPKPIANKWFKDHKDASATVSTYFDTNKFVVIRTLSGVRALSVTTNSEDKTSSVMNNTKITFLEPALATKINDGDIYFIINKKVSNKSQYNKYTVIDPLNPNELAYVKEAYLNVPATQWVVEKNNDTYTLKNRDVISNKEYTGKIYVVDEDQMMYSIGRDTFQLVAADAEKEGHLGYKYISEEIQKISDFALSAVNYANTETPFYLTFNGNEDSILSATSNKEEALTLIPMIVDGKQVTEEYEMNDENLTKQFYQLIAKDGEDTLYLDVEDETNELIVTKVRPVVLDKAPWTNNLYYLQFRSINDQPNAYEVLIGRLVKDADFDTFEPEWKLSYNQDGEAVAVDASTASAFVYDLVDNSTDIYKNFGFEGSTKVIISLNGDAESKVTKIGPFATVKRTGLDETIDADYSLIMDTAYVDHKDNIRYAYYITKPIVAADTAWNAEKFYMVSYTDSLARENDTIKYSQDNLTRIGFVAAKRVGTDSLAITKAVGATAADTLNVTEELGVTNATFAFAIDENNDEAYRIEVAPAKYVSYLNGILVEGAKEQAQLFNVNATDLTPTDNEEISVEAGVQVIGGKGAVTVQGAAGKTVTVYNFQGRALASTTLTSDNQTIAVPAGLVAVSVEGEPEAISVVVK